MNPYLKSCLHKGVIASIIYIYHYSIVLEPVRQTEVLELTAITDSNYNAFNAYFKV